MKKNEIIAIYGEEYTKMTRALLEEAGLAGMIGDKGKRIGIQGGNDASRGGGGVAAVFAGT